MPGKSSVPSRNRADGDLVGGDQRGASRATPTGPPRGRSGAPGSGLVRRPEVEPAGATRSGGAAGDGRRSG